ncbi:MAG: ABC transporter substrate-binding protein [Gemmatimonadaceae bacterium]
MRYVVRRRAVAATVLASVALVTTLTAPAGAQTPNLPAAIAAKKQLTVGVNAIFPPMEFKNPGSNDLIGIDIEIAQAIGQQLGVTIVFSDQKFDQLLQSVTTGRVDFVLSALSDTEARRKTFDFVDYFTSGTQAYTSTAYAGTIKSLDDLSGKTLAVSAATDYLTTMQRWSKDNLEAKGKPGITILPVDSEASARLQIVQRRAQASAISPEVLGWLSKQSPGQFVPIGPVLAPDPYGICFKKGNTELRDAVLAAVKELVRNGTYTRILTKWMATSGATSPVVNQGK